MASVSLRGVEKRFGGFTALERLDLDIRDGEFLVLLGPSGCGKTTTMRIVAGLERPTTGEIRIGEQRVNDALPKDRDVAMVFQNYGLYPHMTVADNIGYPLKVRGVRGEERRRRIRLAAEKVELGPLLGRRPRELSGGQRQRVALARAIVRTPRVFLMDEPLSNLDAKLRVTMRSEIKHLQGELNVTTIYVTHDQIEAMTLAHRIAVMNAGRIQQLATPEETYDRPANLFVAGFIGSPSMNLIPGTVTEGGQFVLEGGDGAGVAVSAPSGPAVLGVRPEDVSVCTPDEGDLAAEVYAVELTGEAVLVTATLRAGRGLRVIARASRAWRGQAGDLIGLALDRAHLHLFDQATGQRRDSR